jgi:uncharacterized DUF497 family protein
VEDFDELTRKAKRLFRERKFAIDPHATDDYPERNITAADIIEVIKIGSVTSEGNTGEGSDRFLWVGEDAADRVLRLVVVIRNNLLVISAAEANRAQTTQYGNEDKP